MGKNKAVPKIINLIFQTAYLIKISQLLICHTSRISRIHIINIGYGQ